MKNNFPSISIFHTLLKAQSRNIFLMAVVMETNVAVPAPVSVDVTICYAKAQAQECV